MVCCYNVCVVCKFGVKCYSNIFLVFFMNSDVLSICRCILMLYYAGSGVNNVQVVLSRLNIRLLSFVHVCNCCRYCCMYHWLNFCWCVKMASLDILMFF